MSNVIRAAAAATKTQEGMFEVLSPEGYSEPDVIAPTAPVASLDNKTVGFVSDYLFRGDELFRRSTRIYALCRMSTSVTSMAPPKPRS
jgi:hypothetical protein